jgi:Sulfotransferase domain
MKNASLPEQKVFCVGFGKTGTTSMEAFFKAMGFQVGDQAAGELLLRDWADRRFNSIIELARTAQFFQDIPFSCPFTFQCLDASFPGSKFVLTIRDSEQWYRSLIRFHTQLLGKKRLPTAQELSECPIGYNGFMSEAMYLVYGTTENDPYNKDSLIATYEFHNSSVKKYFAGRKSDLLVIDLSEEKAAQRIVEFLGMTYQGQRLPHLNRSATSTRAYSARAHKALIAEHEGLIRSYDALALECDALAGARDNLIVERDALAGARNNLIVECDGLRAEREALVRSNIELIAARDSLVTASRDLAGARDAAISERDALLASSSWRLTAPLGKLRHSLAGRDSRHEG